MVPDDTNNLRDVFVRDLLTGTTARVSKSAGGTQANGESTGGAITDDGRFVIFDSVASNLTGDDANGVGDVFLKDLQTARAMVSATGMCMVGISVA